LTSTNANVEINIQEVNIKMEKEIPNGLKNIKTLLIVPVTQKAFLKKHIVKVKRRREDQKLLH
jgi:hypothetical protein